MEDSPGHLVFEWDPAKDLENRAKHHVSFAAARQAFFDKYRVIFQDSRHSDQEQRYHCMGAVGDGILTVRFTLRSGAIRIIGAGYWRKGKKIYEETNRLHG